MTGGFELVLFADQPRGLLLFEDLDVREVRHAGALAALAAVSAASTVGAPALAQSIQLAKPQAHAPIPIATPEAHAPIPVATPEAHPPLAVATPEAHPPLAVATPEAHPPLAVATPEAHPPLAVATPEAHAPIPIATPAAHPPIAIATPEAHAPIAQPRPIDPGVGAETVDPVEGTEIQRGDPPPAGRPDAQAEELGRPGGADTALQDSPGRLAQAPAPAERIPVHRGRPALPGEVEPVEEDSAAGWCSNATVHVGLGFDVTYCPMSPGAKWDIAVGVGLDIGAAEFYDSSPAMDRDTRSLSGEIAAKAGPYAGIDGGLDRELESGGSWTLGVGSNLGVKGVGPTSSISFNTDDGLAATAGVAYWDLADSKAPRGRPPKKTPLRRRVRKGLEAKLGGSIDWHGIKR